MSPKQVNFGCSQILQIPRSRTYKQELALTNEMELFVFTWANQSFVCYVTFSSHAHHVIFQHGMQL